MPPSEDPPRHGFQTGVLARITGYARAHFLVALGVQSCTGFVTSAKIYKCEHRKHLVVNSQSVASASRSQFLRVGIRSGVREIRLGVVHEFYQRVRPNYVFSPFKYVRSRSRYREITSRIAMDDSPAPAHTPLAQSHATVTPGTLSHITGNVKVQ